MDRRRFLTLVSGAATACGPAASRDADPVLAPASDAEPLRFSVNDFPASGLVARGALLLGRDERGAYAMTAVCTHEGCLVGPRPPRDGGSSALENASLECPCHGARFDANGLVVRGPASSPLVHFLVRREDADVIVDPNVTVGAAARAPL